MFTKSVFANRFQKWQWEFNQLLKTHSDNQFLLAISVSLRKSKTAWISSLVVSNNFKDKLSEIDNFFGFYYAASDICYS